MLLVDHIGGGYGVSDFGESREQRFGVYFRIPHGLFLAEYVPLWPALSVPESPEENIPYILLTRVMSLHYRYGVTESRLIMLMNFINSYKNTHPIPFDQIKKNKNCYFTDVSTSLFYLMRIVDSFVDKTA